MIKFSRILKDYREAGTLQELVGVQAAIDNNVFITKEGPLFAMLKVTGVDDECLEPDQVNQIARRIEASLRLLDENFRLYQYFIKSEARPIEPLTNENGVVQQAIAGHAAHLNAQRLQRIELFWSVVYEDCHFSLNGNRISESLRHPVKTIGRMLSTEKTLSSLEAELERARQHLLQRVTSLIVQLRDVFSLQLLDKQQAYLFLRRLLNFNPHKADGPALAFDQYVDFQVCDSAVECYSDHLLVDGQYVKVMTLKEPPPNTITHLFRKIEDLPLNLIVTNEIKRVSNAVARALIQSKRRHFHNSKASLLNYLNKESPKSGEILIDEGAAAMVSDLGDALQALETSNGGFAEFSTSILVYGPDLATVRQACAECYKVFAGHGAHITEERFNLLNAFLAVLPGNSAFNLRRLFMSHANCADLSLAFAPSMGEPWNAFLGAQHLAVLETKQRTLYSLNLHQQDVGHSLLLGSTGSGKSFFLAFLLTQLQKYAPFTFVFDLGGGFQSLSTLFGGAYLRISHESKDVSINPFCLSPTKENLQFLFSFVRVLAESSGYQLSTQDERDLYDQIRNLYEIEIGQRRLGTLANILNRPLGDALGKWVRGGQHGTLFDNVEDTITFSRFQACDFQGLEKYPELLEPLLFYVLHRASVAVENLEYLTTLKAFVIDEAWRFFRNPVIRLYILEALKTWRKRNALMILATQSSDDLLGSDMLAAVAESCPTKFFLANPGMDQEAYSRFFHLNRVEAEIIHSLVPKQELLLKRSDCSKVLRLNVDAKSYWLYTSDPFDSHARQEAFDRYGFEKGLEILSKEIKR
jgi:type IV secretion system protein VirB4